MWDDSIKSLTRSFAHYRPVPILVRDWNDKVGGLAFLVTIAAAFFFTSFRRVTRPGRAALGCAAIAIGAAALMQPWELVAIAGAMPLWSGYLLTAGLIFLAASVVWVVGEDQIERRWPEKIESWYRPFAGHWLSARAARSVLRGWLLGVSILLFYVPMLAAMSALQIGTLRTWLLTWTLQTASPAFFYLVGVAILAALLTLGPIGLPMALLRGRLRPAVAIALTVAIRVIVFHPSEATRATPALAQCLLLALSGALFATCFYVTDVLGTFVAMFVFDAIVGTVWLLRINSDISVVPYIIVLLLIAGIAVFALLSLQHWRSIAPASRRPSGASPFPPQRPAGA